MDQAFRLEDYYSPSLPCDCEICRSYCIRPGWWTIEQASIAIDEGYDAKMMLEIAPDFSFAVLSPAFKGCEGQIAVNEFAKNGCIFFSDGLCELHETSFQPLECKVCHHSSPGKGPKIHYELEKQWNTPQGIDVVIKWMKKTELWDKLPKNTVEF
jgi:hypothetical protein